MTLPAQEAPEKIWATSAMTMDGQKWVDDEGAEYTRSDIAERQIAELRAELDKARAARDRVRRIFRRNVRLRMVAESSAEAAEAENARLRALPLKDEVERVLEQAKVVLQGEAAGRTWYEQTAEALEDVDALLSRIRAGEKEGWRLVPVEPTDAMRSAGADAAMAVGDVYTRPDGTVVIETAIARDIYRAMLAAAPSEQGGDRG